LSPKIGQKSQKIVIITSTPGQNDPSENFPSASAIDLVHGHKNIRFSSKKEKVKEFFFLNYLLLPKKKFRKWGVGLWDLRRLE
jgi:hypothetical protein